MEMGRVCRIAEKAMKQAVRYIHFYRRPYRNVHFFFSKLYRLQRDQREEKE